MESTEDKFCGSSPLVLGYDKPVHRYFDILPMLDFYSKEALFSCVTNSKVINFKSCLDFWGRIGLEMYLWKVDSLVDDFRQNKVTQKEELKYMLFFSILSLLAADPFFSCDATYNFYDGLNSVLTLIITIAGIYYCYKVNSHGDNKDFMVRLISIGTPVSIRLLVVAIPIFIIGAMIESNFFLTPEEFESDSMESTLSLVVLVSLLMIGYYWYLSKKIKDVSS